MAATAAWCGHGRGISATTLGEQEEGERGPRWVGSAPVASWAKVHSSFWPFVFSFFVFLFPVVFCIYFQPRMTLQKYATGQTNSKKYCAQPQKVWKKFELDGICKNMEKQLIC